MAEQAKDPKIEKEKIETEVDDKSDRKEELTEAASETISPEVTEKVEFDTEMKKPGVVISTAEDATKDNISMHLSQLQTKLVNLETELTKSLARIEVLETRIQVFTGEKATNDVLNLEHIDFIDSLNRI